MNIIAYTVTGVDMNFEVDPMEERKSNADEENVHESGGESEVNESADEEGKVEAATIKPKINVDDVLRELVERKSKMQSYTHFNLEAAVDVSIFVNYKILHCLIFCELML